MRGPTLAGRRTSPGVPFVLFIFRRYKVGGPLQRPNAVIEALVDIVNILSKGRGFLRGPNIRCTQILDGSINRNRTCISGMTTGIILILACHHYTMILGGAPGTRTQKAYAQEFSRLPDYQLSQRSI